MRQVVSILMLMALTSEPAMAEGACPPGQIPYTGTPAEGTAASIASCGPIQTSRPASPQWETRWGAVASDEKGAFGIVTDMKSERQARKFALAQCKELGGVSCRSGLTFHNQCVAVVTSATRSFTQGAPYEDQAIATGMKRCEASNSGECWVYYSGCSLPVRVR